MGANEKVREKLKTLPAKPGVYMMKDEKGDVIYVGKAVNLKNRVRQYFTGGGKHIKTAAMVNKVDTFEYIITDGEIEALILECNLIKQYRPYYNILLRDDKHYPYVRIDMNKPFPRIEVVRKVRNDGAKYYGPYIAAHLVGDVLNAVSKTFPLRTCKKDLSANKRPDRPCINYEMGRCLAPCAGKVTEREYKKMLVEVGGFLSGKGTGLLKRLRSEMKTESAALHFEKAAVIRDNIRALERVMENQKASFPDLNDKDIFALYIEGEEAVAQAFFVRKGKLNHTERFFVSCRDETPEDVMAQVLKQYYSAVPNIANHIFVGVAPSEQHVIEEWLRKTKGAAVHIAVPQRGDNKKLVDMAKNNAKETLKRKISRKKQDYDKTKGALIELAEVLSIGFDIRRIECYDISNTQGTDSVGSMVVFTDGKPDKKAYRRFKIKTVAGPDDFRSMAEVIKRRFQRGLTQLRELERSGRKAQEGGFSTLPELVVIDGGKGQLGAAVSMMEALGLHEMPVIGLAKRHEEIFVPGQSSPIILDEKSSALKLLQRIRDEAHRFAITYHRKLRAGRMEKSVLDDIPGIGKVRRKALLRRFSSVDDIKKASIKTLLETDKMDSRSARAVYEYFRGKDGKSI